MTLMPASFHAFMYLVGLPAPVTTTGTRYVNHNLRDLVGKWAHQHDVHAKGLIRPGAQLVNLVAQPVGVGVHGRDNA